MPASMRHDAAPWRQVPCPTCKAPTVFAASNPWRPFCSERCRSLDLGAWAAERYRVEGSTDPRDDNDDSDSSTAP